MDASLALQTNIFLSFLARCSTRSLIKLIRKVVAARFVIRRIVFPRARLSQFHQTFPRELAATLIPTVLFYSFSFRAVTAASCERASLYGNYRANSTRASFSLFLDVHCCTRPFRSLDSAFFDSALKTYYTFSRFAPSSFLSS